MSGMNPDRRGTEHREVRVAIAGWLSGLPAGAFFAAAIAGVNPYIALSLFLAALVLWLTVRAAIFGRVWK